MGDDIAVATGRMMARSMSRAKDRAIHRMYALLVTDQLYSVMGMRPKRRFWLKRLEQRMPWW